MRSACLVAAAAAAGPAGAEQLSTVAAFKHNVSPILEDYCYECHGDGMARGKVAFDDKHRMDEQTDVEPALMELRQPNRAETACRH